MDPELAGGITHLIWPVNVPGSPQEELESVAQPAATATRPRISVRKWMDGWKYLLLLVPPSSPSAMHNCQVIQKTYLFYSPPRCLSE